MSKTTLAREIHKELTKLNTRIDKKIVQGQRFALEAQRHKELLATLRRIEHESGTTSRAGRRSWFRVTSPVRRSIDRGVIARLLTLQVV